MSIETEKSSCPYCSTRLRYCYINLTEKMLMCTKKKCLFPFDLDDVSPYIIKVDSMVNTNGNINGENINGIADLSPTSISTTASSSLLSPILMDDKLINSNLKPTKSKIKPHNRNLSGIEESLTNLPGLSQVIEPSSTTESNNFNIESSLIQSTTNPLDKVVHEGSINNSTITLKTLGVTLKIDQPNKNKSQQNSSQFNENIPDAVVASVEKDLTNDFPISAFEGSLVNTTNSTTGNGLLNDNATSKVDGSNVLTVEEYSQMLFGQSDIDINFDLDNMLPNFNTIDVSMRSNDANTANTINTTNMGNMDNMDLDNLDNMENMDMDLDLDLDLDKILGTFDPLESNKVSGNGLNLDFDSFMASLGESFAGNDIGMSGNNLNSVMVNTDGVNGIQDNIVNGHLDIYAEIVNGNSMVNGDSMINGNSNDDNHSMLVDSTLENVNGQNGYHEKTKNGVNGLVTLESVNGQNGYHENGVNGLVTLENVNEQNGYHEKTKNGVNGMVTLENVNGQNGYHEKTKNGVNGLVEDEGKNGVGKTERLLTEILLN